MSNLRGRLRLLLLLCCGPLGVVAPSRADLAIVVSRDSRIESLTADDLEQILRQDRRYWQASRPIRLILPPPESAARATLLRVVLKKTEHEYQQFVVGRLFRGDISSPPRTAQTAAEMRQAVASDPHAIGVLDAADVDASVRALPIGGKAPLTPGYPLR